ncbi:MAG: enoyl-CoA hydratase [Ilumatobacteraceae bacterium]|nr:enoyl-CoA hydratase [Ilumatobacteraceae bacterium]
MSGTDATPASTSDEPSLLVERRDAVVILTMNRPARRNALSLDMIGRLADAWEMIDSDETIRCAILTGAGSHYCTGGDLASGWMGAGYQPQSDAEARVLADPSRIGKGLLLTTWLRKPLIAAVGGDCMGGGCEMLQQTDIRISEEHVRFAVPEAKRGLIAGAGSTMRLKRQIPYAIAMEMLITGRALSAAEALQWGLVNYLVPTGGALDKALEIAAAVCACAPLSVEMSKASAVETGWLPESEAQPIEGRYSGIVTRSADAREGMRAFMERRPPNFTGH